MSSLGYFEQNIYSTTQCKEITELGSMLEYRSGVPSDAVPTAEDWIVIKTVHQWAGRYCRVMRWGVEHANLKDERLAGDQDDVSSGSTCAEGLDLARLNFHACK